MSISSEDLQLGRQASLRIKKYELRKSKRWIAYLIPLIWLFSSIARFEASHKYWNIFQLIFWSIATGLVIIFEYKSKKTYLRDRATLEVLRKTYGCDPSFEEMITANNTDAEFVDSLKNATNGEHRLNP
jgi:positive regulator of sigma E activity